MPTVEPGRWDTRALLATAERCLAGGVLHHLTALPPEARVVLVRGRGSRVWDSDGREYLDYYLGSASMVLGHAHPEVLEAVRAQQELGTQFFELTPAAIQLAERLTQVVPCAERVKFANSGSEATAAALKLARAHTGRDHVLKFEGAYHGTHDWAVWGALHRAPLAYPWAEADSIGVPRGLGDYVLVAPYNDLAAASAHIRAHRDRLAAVMMEPLLGNVRPAPGFLEGVRAVTAESGIPLIFDEVVSGFRLALGGAQEYYGVVPDLTALGKSLGGGYPIGAIVGRADLFDSVTPAAVARGRFAMYTGTFSGNPVSCAAALATLNVLQRPGVYARLHGLAQRLADGLREISARLGRATFVVNEGPMVDMWFTDRRVDSYPAIWTADVERGRAFKLGLIRRGIWSPPGLKMFLSLAHTDEDIVRTLEAAEAAMKAL
jgi:glutamate-1-semialdehyde 2,1-aminomutase